MRIPNPPKVVLCAPLMISVLLTVATCERAAIILDHNARLPPFPSTDRLVGEETSIPKSHRRAIQLANEELEEVLNRHQLPAISIAIGLDGDLLSARALGLSDLETGAPVALSTKFRVGSTAKAVTGTLAAKLA